MKRAAALGVALLALLLCTGCGSSSAATRKTTETMRISAILPHNDYGYWTMVAGGINENNVVYLARNVRPFGVDVSSGIEEAPGVKSMEKMRTFMKNLQEALRHEGNA